MVKGSERHKSHDSLSFDWVCYVNYLHMQIYMNMKWYGIIFQKEGY